MSIGSSSAKPPPSASLAVPERLPLGSLTLVPTTSSRSTDDAAAAKKAGDGRRCSRDAALWAFCFVAEADGLSDTAIAWHYAPLEDYDRKKLRVDAAAVQHSLSGATAGPVAVYYRLPGSHTFRQLAVSVATGTSSTTATTTTGPITATASMSPTEDFIVSHSPNDTGRATPFRALSSSGTCTTSDPPPPLSRVHATTAPAADMVNVDTDRPQQPCVVCVTRYEESESVLGTALSSSASHDESPVLPAPLALALTQTATEEEETREKDAEMGGFVSNAPSASPSAAPHRPPTLSAPCGIASARRRLYRALPPVATAYPVASAAVAACTSAAPAHTLGSTATVSPPAGAGAMPTSQPRAPSGTLLLGKLSNNNFFHVSTSGSLGDVTRDGGNSSTTEDFLTNSLRTESGGLELSGGVGSDALCSRRGSRSTPAVVFEEMVAGPQLFHGSIGPAQSLTPARSPTFVRRRAGAATVTAAAEGRARALHQTPSRPTIRRATQPMLSAKLV